MMDRVVPVWHRSVLAWTEHFLFLRRIVFNHIGKGNAGPCLFDTLPYAFGGGAEYRGTPSEYPFPYAYVTTGEENWTANIHAIRSEGVNDVKKCIECHCWDDPSSVRPST